MRHLPLALLALTLALGSCAAPEPAPMAADPESSAAAWAAQLSSSDPATRDQAMVNLTGLGEAAVPYLVPLLQSESAPTRFAAAATLTQLEAAAVAAVPALIEALSDPQWRVRVQAADALGLMNSDPPLRHFGAPGIPRLTELLDDESWQVRYHASLALGNMGADAVEAMEPLKKVSRYDLNENVRTAARDAFESIVDGRRLARRGHITTYYPDPSEDAVHRR
jgi:HEAT repeat protein